MTAPDLDALRALRDRVAAADGPDRGLDYAIQETIVRKLALRSTVAWFSESLDAAVALVERMLPSATWTLHSNGNAIVYPGGKRQFSDTAPTTALALLNALLKALIAQIEHDGAQP